MLAHGYRKEDERQSLPQIGAEWTLLYFTFLNAYFKKGDLNHIKDRIVLNKPGQSNEYSELWINVIKRIGYSKVIFRVSNNVTIRGFTVVSFFGGDRSFTTKIDTYTLYKNFIYYDY